VSSELLWKWLNFAILSGGLGYLIYKNAGAFFRSRSEGIRRAMEEADRLRREALARLAEAEERLKNLEADIQALRAHAAQEMAAENERLRREAEETLKKIRQQAEQEIAGAAKTARREVRAHAAELAVGMAASRIRSLLTPEVDQELVASFLNDLEKPAGDSSGKQVN
jgi:F0F1-type ATP synthase membrane subunit b/b'